MSLMIQQAINSVWVLEIVRDILSWSLHFLNFSLAIVLKIKIFQIFDYMEDLISNVPYTKSRKIGDKLNLIIFSINVR